MVNYLLENSWTHFEQNAAANFFPAKHFIETDWLHAEAINKL